MGLDPTTAATRLAALPSARGVPALRPGRNLNTARPANQEAYLGQIAGVLAGSACSHCDRGFGVWGECVVVAGEFGGSCCNCHFGSEGARCSLRVGKFTIHFPLVYGWYTDFTDDL